MVKIRHNTGVVQYPQNREQRGDCICTTTECVVLWALLSFLSNHTYDGVIIDQLSGDRHNRWLLISTTSFIKSFRWDIVSTEEMMFPFRHDIIFVTKPSHTYTCTKRNRNYHFLCWSSIAHLNWIQARVGALKRDRAPLIERPENNVKWPIFKKYSKNTDCAAIFRPKFSKMRKYTIYIHYS